MFGERNIKLGCGKQSVTCQGTNIVLTEEACKGVFFREERFDCRAMLCESREDLQKKFTQEVSLNASSAGAELSANASMSRKIGKDSFDSFYMLVIECIEGRQELNKLGGTQQILLPEVEKEIATLQTVEDWEEFYRTKGDRVVCSTVIGSKTVILISLKNKTIQKDLLQVLQVKFATPSSASGAAGIAVKLQEQLTLLGQENISHMEVHSFGDSNPNFMRFIEQISDLKTKLAQFINPEYGEASKSFTDLGKFESWPGAKLASAEGRGRILAFVSCSYMDLLPKTIRQEVTDSYHQFLQRTNRAAKFMACISRVYNRATIFSEFIDYYLDGHDGAFAYDVLTEAAAHDLKKELSSYEEQLITLSDKVVKEIAGLNTDHRLRERDLVKARSCLGLSKDISKLYDARNLGAFYKIVSEQMALIHQFQPLFPSDAQPYLTVLDEKYSKILETFNTYHQAEETIMPVWLKVGGNVYQCILQALAKPLCAIENAVNFLNDHFADEIDDIQRVKKNWDDYSEILLKFLKPFQDNSEDNMSGFAAVYCKPLVSILTQWPNVQAVCHAGVQKDVGSVVEDGRKIMVFLNQLRQALKPWDALLQQREVLKNFLTTLPSSSKSSYDIAMLDKAFDVLFSIESSGAELFTSPILQQLKEFFHQNRELFTRFFAMKMDFLATLSEKADQCQLDKPTVQAIAKICQNYVDAHCAQVTSEQWWESVWQKTIGIAKKLDYIVTNTIPPEQNTKGMEMYKKIYAVIDFKKPAFRLGTMDLVRHKWFKRNLFSGQKYTKLMIPMEATSLRFQFAEAHKFPDNSLVFNIERASAIRMEDRHAKHRILHRNTVLGGPIIPQRLTKAQILNILKRFRGDKALWRISEMFNAANEKIVYKKVRIKNAYFKQPLHADMHALQLNVFAQMGHLGQGLEPLCLGDNMPTGEAYYGYRFRSNATPDDHKYARVTRRGNSFSEIEPTAEGSHALGGEPIRSGTDVSQYFFGERRSTSTACHGPTTLSESVVSVLSQASSSRDPLNRDLRENDGKSLQSRNGASSKNKQVPL